MDWLSVHAFPVCGAFVVGEGVEEGFAECGVGVEGGVPGGVFRSRGSTGTSACAMEAVMVAMSVAAGTVGG